MIGANIPAPPAAGIGGSTGSTDNSVLRADGTGGATLQNSGLVVEDTIVSFTTVTGDAGTDVITVTGSAFANQQPVRFTALTGGSGLNTTTNYFVREVSGATFKLETSVGGGAINFTTNITAGTLLTGHSVQVNVTLSENTTETNSALVLTPKGTGALIAGPKPDGTGVGGNARGARAVDLQITKGAATRVASGNDSVICGGEANTASGVGSVVSGGSSNTASGSYAVVCGGVSCTASGTRSCAAGGEGSIASGGYSFAAAGIGANASGNSSVAFNGAASGVGSFAIAGTANTTSAFTNGGLSDRRSMQSHAGGNFSALGDAQRARFVLRNKTTTSSAVELFLDGSSTRLTIPSGKYLTGTINIAGIKSDGTAAASYIRQFSIKNVAGTTSLVGTVNTIGTDEAASTSISITANDTNDALKVEVTGITSETWRWVAAVDVVEVAYGA
jgi:hypothetical protein